ncbi:MAG: 3-dehydroquinate synthase family protein, partial [Pseudomonadota bacterium]
MSVSALPSDQLVVPVDLGERSYEIAIGPGLLRDAGKLINGHLPRKKTAIVTDENVAGAHLADLLASLEAEGIEADVLTLPAGESTQSQAHLFEVTDFLLEAGVERNDVIIALGGGVIGDLAGFAAAILRRGVNFIQVPTSLLAQVDSSVGGKTGINASAGKNLIGAFHQPVLVLADTAVLDSLPLRELKAGYAEVA